ncbi:MAG: outer membrane beta-barrel protein [Candidatus Omnitrophota bacterium]
MQKDKTATKFLILKISLIMLGLLVSNSYADILSRDLPNREGLKLGEALFHSALRTQVEFDSNIYLTDKNEKYDIITMINPSIGLKIPLRDNGLSFEYDIAVNEFSRFHENDHIDHRLLTLLEVNLTDYQVTLDDEWRRFTDRAGSEDVNRTKRQTNSLRLGVATTLDQLSFDIAYLNFWQDYLVNKTIINGLDYNDKDSLTHVLDIEAAYRFMPKTSALWENKVGFIDYYHSSLPPDSYFIESLLGVKGEWLAKTTVDLRGGVKFQDYETSTVLSDENYLNFVAKGVLEHSLSDDDTVKLKAERNTYESTYSNMNYYEANMIGFDYKHKFYKVTAEIFGQAQQNRYPDESTEDGETAKRKDKLYNVGGALRYDVRNRVSLEAKYEYKKRDSRFKTLDYIEHLTTLRCTIGF